MDEIKKIITVDTTQAVTALENMKKSGDDAGQSFKSMKEYKEYVDKMRAALADLDTTTEEYTKAANDVAAAQDKYNKILSETKTTTTAAEGSYNALAKQMAELRKAWKATTDETERANIGTQINAINDQLKELDASIGNYQRNVGNYASGFTAGMKDMLDGLDNLAPGAKKAGKAFNDLGKAAKAFIANPIGAVIAAIVAVFMLLKNAIEKNEKATEAIKKAMKSFEPILNLVSNAVGFLGEKIAVVVDWLGNKLTGALEWVINKGLNKFVNGVIKGINMMSKPWRMFYSWVIGGIEAIVSAANKIGQLTGLFDISGAVSALDKAKNAVRDFEIASVDLNLSFEKLTASSESAADAEKKVTGAAKDATAALEREKAVLEERLKVAEEGSKEYYDLLIAIENKEWEIQQIKLKNEKYTDEQIEAFRTAHLKKLADINAKAAGEGITTDAAKEAEEAAKVAEEARIAVLKRSKEGELQLLTAEYEKQKALLEKYGKDTTDLTANYEKNRADIEKKYADQRTKAFEDRKKQLDEEAALETYLASKKPANTLKEQFEQQMQLLDIERQRLDGRKALLEEMLLADDLEIEQKEKLKDELARINADIIANDDAHTEAVKANISKQIGTYNQLASGISSIMSTISSMMEDDIKRKIENGEISEEEAEKEFERVKGMQLATTWINTLAGVATAIAGAMSLGPIAGPIVGAINSAAVLASGIAQTVKIKQTKFDGKGAGQGGTDTGAATPTTPAASYSPEYTANLTGASDIENLSNAVSQGTATGQQAMKVYVTEQDINEVATKVRVRDSEATF